MARIIGSRPADPGTADPDFVNWREFDPSCLPDGADSPLATELAAYRDHLDALMPRAGDYVVIADDTIVGIYADRRAALDAAHDARGGAPVLVKRIVEREPARRLGGVAL